MSPLQPGPLFNRRSFLGVLGLPLLAPGVLLDPLKAAAVLAALPPADDRPPEEVAEDEDYWAPIARAFTVDRSLVDLNNGGVSPAPAFVQQAMARHLAFSNEAPPYTMWRVLEPQREAVRERMARAWGVDPEEIALTRNASESLQICQLGFDLSPGDEVLTTDQDYPRMIRTFQQRERREGIVLKQISLPVPCEDEGEVVRRFEAAITPQTKLLLMCHMVNLTGQILPVKKVVAMAHTHGLPVIVDGAHALAHVDFKLSDLDCDFYGSSLHKWLCAPHGTGLLYVRKARIPELWPMMAADATQDDDIRKFEEIGTHPAANALAVAEALTFHEGIGPARKEARLRWLRDSWARPLLTHDRVHLHTSLDPRFSCGIATVEVEGVDSKALNRWLWQEHKILVRAIDHPAVQGLRVSPSVYTTREELDRFVAAMESVIRNGLPG